MKEVFFILLFFYVNINMFSQRNLTIEDRSDEFSVFGGERDEAGIIFSCDLEIPLSFSFNYQPLIPTKTDTVASIVNYHFKFRTGKGFNRRKIVISSKGYNSLEQEVSLTPKQQKEYFIQDESKKTLDCYYQLTKEAEELFQDQLYLEAKTKYILSKECFDSRDEVEINTKIALIDSIVKLRTQANIDFDLANYKEAIDGYNKIISLNRRDYYVQERLNESRKRYGESCSLYFNNAESCYINGDYKSARELYNKIIDQDCYQAEIASSRINAIDNKEKDKAQKAFVLNYEISKTTELGFSIGKYKENKSNGYFTLRTNADTFESIRSEEENLTPELNISFGWTLKPIKRKDVPVWLFFGPGFTGIGKFLAVEPEIENRDARESNATERELELEICTAVSPEIGVLGKIGPLALRYTFQYRFAIQKEHEVYIGKTMHIFGLGVCF